MCEWTKLFLISAAIEWTGKKDLAKEVVLHFDDLKGVIQMWSQNKTKLQRVVDFKRMDTVMTWLSHDARRDLVLIQMPKEYDLVSHVPIRGVPHHPDN